MYRTGDLLDHEIMRDDRNFAVLVCDEEGHMADSDGGDIVSMRHTLSTNDSSIVIGDIITQTVTIEFALGIWGENAGADALNLNRGKKIRISYSYPRVAFDDEIPVGVFKVVDSTKKGKRLIVTARDLFYGIDREYVSNLTYPTAIKNVLAEAAQQIGIPFKAPSEILETKINNGYEYTYDANDCCIMVRGEGEYIVPAKPVGLTLQQIISKCAEVYGMTVYQNREGYLDFCAPLDDFAELSHVSGTDEYESQTYVIEPKRADEPEKGKQKVVIAACKVIVNGSIVHQIDSTVDPDEVKYEMVIEDPIIPWAQAEDLIITVLDMYFDRRYTPASIYHRMGDPRLDIFDPVWCVEFDPDDEFKVFGMYISSLDYYFDGGLATTVNSSIGDTVGNIGKQSKSVGTRSAKSVQSQPRGGGPVSQKIERMQVQISELAAEIENIKKIIAPKKEER